jgi:YD repeat-containing protein
MALDPAFSRLALREKYALSVEGVEASELPAEIRGYYNPAFLIERRILYENGKESRRQWLFRDTGGKTRLNAVLIPPPEASAEEDTPDPEEEAEDEDTAQGPPGFIEIYNEDNLMVEEHRLNNDGSDEIINYAYNNRILIRTNTRLKFPPSDEEGEVTQDLWTDYYRYSRFASLRGINRVYHSDVPTARLRFPHMVLDVGKPGNFIGPNDAYSSLFLQDVFINRGDRVVYVTDNRGRILTETRYDETGEVIGEIKNTWAENNKIQSVHWTAKEDDRLIEYEYDAEGDRIEERNYNKGVLERMVQFEGPQEVETLYMQGRPVLKAIWEEGRKISEERIRSRPETTN